MEIIKVRHESLQKALTANEKISDKIYAHIPRYHGTMKMIIDRISISV